MDEAANPYGPGRPKRWLRGRTKLPTGTAGEYRIVSRRTGRPKYIGESGDLQRRLNEHTRRPTFATSRDKSHLYDPSKHEIVYQVAISGASTTARRTHEKNKIAEHAPSWNLDCGGSGRK